MITLKENAIPYNNVKKKKSKSLYGFYDTEVKYPVIKGITLGLTGDEVRERANKNGFLAVDYRDGTWTIDTLIEKNGEKEEIDIMELLFDNDVVYEMRLYNFEALFNADTDELTFPLIKGFIDYYLKDFNMCRDRNFNRAIFDPEVITLFRYEPPESSFMVKFQPITKGIYISKVLEEVYDEHIF